MGPIGFSLGSSKTHTDTVWRGILVMPFSRMNKLYNKISTTDIWSVEAEADINIQTLAKHIFLVHRSNETRSKCSPIIIFETNCCYLRSSFGRVFLRFTFLFSSHRLSNHDGWTSCRLHSEWHVRPYLIGSNRCHTTEQVHKHTHRIHLHIHIYKLCGNYRPCTLQSITGTEESHVLSAGLSIMAP